MWASVSVLDESTRLGSFSDPFIISVLFPVSSLVVSASERPEMLDTFANGAVSGERFSDITPQRHFRPEGASRLSRYSECYQQNNTSQDIHRWINEMCTGGKMKFWSRSLEHICSFTNAAFQCHSIMTVLWEWAVEVCSCSPQKSQQFNLIFSGSPYRRLGQGRLDNYPERAMQCRLSCSHPRLQTLLPSPIQLPL